MEPFINVLMLVVLVLREERRIVLLNMSKPVHKRDSNTDFRTDSRVDKLKVWHLVKKVKYKISLHV